MSIKSVILIYNIKILLVDSLCNGAKTICVQLKGKKKYSLVDEDLEHFSKIPKNFENSPKTSRSSYEHFRSVSEISRSYQKISVDYRRLQNISEQSSKMFRSYRN